MQLRSRYCGALAVLIAAATLSGCANPEVFQSNERWFERPFDWTGRSGGYTFSELQEAHEKRRPVTAADLVSPNGACPPPPVAAVPAAPAPLGAGVALTEVVPPSLLGQGIALGMTECEVVWRAGAPASVQFGANPNGNRTAVLTYDSGPRPGIYRFEAGRLMDMDRVAATVPEEPKIAGREARKKKAREPANTERISTE